MRIRGLAGASPVRVGQGWAWTIRSSARLERVTDEERRRRVVQWMQNVGDPWTRADSTPAAGSQLAEDDEAKPIVSPVASYSIVTAIDHLGSVVDAMVNSTERFQPMRHYAHFTTLRTTLLSSTRVRWLLEPDGREERQLRCVRIRYQNLDEQRKAVRVSGGTHLDADQEQARLKAIDSMDAEEASLATRATALGAAKLENPPNMVEMLKLQEDGNTWLGSGVMHLWRSGSATAHGYHWPDLFRAAPGWFDEEAYNSALYGGFLKLQEALKLYDQRAAPPTESRCETSG